MTTDVAHAPNPFNESIGLSFDSFADDGSTVWSFQPAASAFGDEAATVVHGGALAGCIEYGAAHAVYSADTSGSEWMPVDLHTDFLRIVGQDRYRVIGKVVRMGKRTAVASTRIEKWDDPGYVAAEGRIVLARI